MYNLGFPRSTHFIIPIIIIDDFILHLAIILYTNSSHIIIHNFVKTGFNKVMCNSGHMCTDCLLLYMVIVGCYVRT